MSDRDRLAWLVKNALAAYGAEADSSKKPQDFMADFLLSSGVIVPPCKVGSNVFRPIKYLEIVAGWEIVKMECFEEEAYFIDDSDNVIEFSDFGKTVFLTREEAEQALKEHKEK